MRRGPSWWSSASAICPSGDQAEPDRQAMRVDDLLEFGREPAA